MSSMNKTISFMPCESTAVLLYSFFWTFRTLLTALVKGDSITFMLISAEMPLLSQQKLFNKYPLKRSGIFPLSP